MAILCQAPAQSPPEPRASEHCAKSRRRQIKFASWRLMNRGDLYVLAKTSRALGQPKPPVMGIFGSLLLTLVCVAEALVEVGGGSAVRSKTLVNSAQAGPFRDVILNKRPIRFSCGRRRPW